ncbi:MAG: ABC-type transporter, integral membrane subunit [Desulfonauticus sp. 38_4375]|nr:MAG: ABC-type transporter, integral membrane subunit [Desulfonauticus sp. 38_4375]
MEIFQFSFMQHAFVAALLLSIACGFIGPLVVINRQVFLAGGMAHAAFGGVGLAFFFSLPVLPTVFVYTFFLSLVFGLLVVNQRELSETIVGIIWAGGMALGIILLDLTPGYKTELTSYLFGSILTLSKSDLSLACVLDFLLVGTIWWKYKEFVTISFDSEYAKTLGIKVNNCFLILIVLAGFSVVILMQLVGIVLLISLLTIPVYLAKPKSDTLYKMIFKSTLWSLFFSYTGLFLSFYFNLNSGAAIISVAIFSFLLVNLKRMLLNKESKTVFVDGQL